MVLIRLYQRPVISVGLKMMGKSILLHTTFHMIQDCTTQKCELSTIFMYHLNFFLKYSFTGITHLNVRGQFRNKIHIENKLSCRKMSSQIIKAICLYMFNQGLKQTRLAKIYMYTKHDKIYTKNNRCASLILLVFKAIYSVLLPFHQDFELMIQTATYTTPYLHITM